MTWRRCCTPQAPSPAPGRRGTRAYRHAEWPCPRGCRSPTLARTRPPRSNRDAHGDNPGVDPCGDPGRRPRSPDPDRAQVAGSTASSRRTLDPVIQGATCDVIVQRGRIKPDTDRVLVLLPAAPTRPRPCPSRVLCARGAHHGDFGVANADWGRPGDARGRIAPGYDGTEVEHRRPAGRRYQGGRSSNACCRGISTEAHQRQAR